MTDTCISLAKPKTSGARNRKGKGSSDGEREAIACAFAHGSSPGEVELGGCRGVVPVTACSAVEDAPAWELLACPTGHAICCSLDGWVTFSKALYEDIESRSTLFNNELDENRRLSLP